MNKSKLLKIVILAGIVLVVAGIIQLGTVFSQLLPEHR